MTKELSSTASISKLIKVVEQLRDPKDGCPWDLEQTHNSLIPFVLEEAHEVADAIRQNDDKNLCEELGDLLLQVVLHAQIANEEQRFDLTDIAEGITQKLIRRHPHVFLQKTDPNSKEVERSWEDIKRSERINNKNNHQFIDNLKEKIRPQPAAFGSMYISKKVAKLGFEWKNVEDIWNKLDEEINEFKLALKKSNKINTQEELGDIIFTIINIARWYKLNPEEALEVTNKKFLKRFSYIESTLKGNLENQPIEKLESLWEEAKKLITNNEF